jgi:ABC-2 type transport system permease protein
MSSGVVIAGVTSSRAGISRTLRALPAILRVYIAENLAWRAEFFIWMLAYTMPLIMLALWTAVAREAPIGRFGEQELRAYFLTTLVFRMIVASWVVWQMNMEIRQGAIAARLLRPLHPLLSYACHQLAAAPLRLVLVTPIVALGLWWVGPDALTDDPRQLLLLPISLAGAWLLTFAVMALIGSLAFYWESALGLFDLWLGFYTVFSGYVMPLEFFPAGVQRVIAWLPFRYMLSFPVETALGLTDWHTSLRSLALQGAWTLVILVLALAVWRRGVRRYAAFGG